MFTGIIRHLGRVMALERYAGGARLTISCTPPLDCVEGGSVALDGVCLTVVATHPQRGLISFDIGPETDQLTTLGQRDVGTFVHVELPLRLSDLVDGHLVQGHVDGIGTVIGRTEQGASCLLTIEAAADLLRFCVMKGSIAVSGVSLTINALTDTTFSVCLIPATLEKTLFSSTQVGDRVHLEVDVISKYVHRLMGPST